MGAANRYRSFRPFEMKLTLVVELDSIHTGVVAEQREDTACLLTTVLSFLLRSGWKEEDQKYL
jgi:hypothetical protein